MHPFVCCCCGICSPGTQVVTMHSMLVTAVLALVRLFSNCIGTSLQMMQEFGMFTVVLSVCFAAELPAPHSASRSHRQPPSRRATHRSRSRSRSRGRPAAKHRRSPSLAPPHALPVSAAGDGRRTGAAGHPQRTRGRSRSKSPGSSSSSSDGSSSSTSSDRADDMSPGAAGPRDTANSPTAAEDMQTAEQAAAAAEELRK